MHQQQKWMYSSQQTRPSLTFLKGKWGQLAVAGIDDETVLHTLE